MLIHDAFRRVLSLRDDSIYHQDEPPTHYYYRVRTYLENKRPENKENGGGPVQWEARSPDLIPCDFFQCGYLK